MLYTEVKVQEYADTLHLLSNAMAGYYSLILGLIIIEKYIKINSKFYG